MNRDEIEGSIPVTNSKFQSLASLTDNKIPSLYLSFRCRDTIIVLPSQLSPSFLITRFSLSVDRYSLVLAVLRMRTLTVIAHPSFRFRNKLVLSRGITIKNVVLVEIRGSISGCWSVSKIFPLQKERYFTESRSLGLLSLPALEHQIVDVLGGGGWPRQVIEAVSRILLATVFGIGVAAVSGMMQLPQALHHFLIGQVLVGNTSAEIQNLPEGDCESPHVALGRILSLEIRRNVTRVTSTPGCSSRITNKSQNIVNTPFE